MLSSPFRVVTGQCLRLRKTSNRLGVIRAYARILYDDGGSSLLTLPSVTFTANTVEVFASEDVVLRDGWCVYASVEMVTTGVYRGDVYVQLSFSPSGAILLQDYSYEAYWPTLGVFREPGPGGGEGRLVITTVKAAGAPTASTVFALAGNNRIRKIHGYAWYYNVSSDVASRTLDVELRNPLGAVPAGFTGAAAVWQAPQLTLTADEEGVAFGGLLRDGFNDADVLTISDRASAPVPFPYWSHENDSADLAFLVANSNANDRDVIYALVESWQVG